MKKIIHVNQHKIRANTKNGTDDPVLTVKTYKENKYAHEAILKKDGAVIGKVVYSPHKPLGCGARVWIEFDTDEIDVDLVIRDGDMAEQVDAGDLKSPGFGRVGSIPSIPTTKKDF